MQDACICYLIQSSKKSVNKLIKSLKFLKKNFLNQFPYPVILFIEDDFRNEWKEIIRNSTGISCRFENVTFSIPDHVQKKDVIQHIKKYGFPIGYRHMCQFFSKGIYEHPALEEFKWYWRLDDDSFILDRIQYDVFSFMKEKNYLYGYNKIYNDSIWCTTTLWEKVESYINKYSIKPYFLNKFIKNGIWDRSLYYTNFEISCLDFWKSEQYKKFIDHLDQSGGIYFYRWGDAPIHLLAVSIFLQEKQVHKFDDIAYIHLPFIHLANSRNVSTYMNALPFFVRMCIESILQKLRIYKFLKKLYRSL